MAKTINQWAGAKALRVLLVSGSVVPAAAQIRAQPVWAQQVQVTQVQAQQEETEPADTSHLAAINLPEGAERMLEQSIPATISESLETLVKAGGNQVKQGRKEVLVWRGKGYKKSAAPKLMAQVADELQKTGWEYKTGGENPDIQLVSLTRDKPKPRAVIGMWVVADEALILSWTEMLAATQADGAPDAAGVPDAVDTAPDAAVAKEETPEKTETDGDNGNDNTPAAKTPTAAGATVLEVPGNVSDLNIMKSAMPKIPAFPALKPKPGFVRGYVKDSNGKPLAGARLGVRSTAVGGAYSGAQGKTDNKGYYEIQVPFGAAHFYNAGYTIDYGEGRAALGLHPADGELDSFASNVGGVENFVLLPYGIANRDEVQDNPRYSGNYYGGEFVLSYSIVDEREDPATARDLPPNSTIEITLTPQGPLINGSKGRVFVIRKKVAESFGQLYVVNIPIGVYRIDAKLAGGAPLKMKEVGPNGGSAFGIDPKEATGTATLYLRPSSAKAESAMAGHGNWEHVSLALTTK